MTQHDPVCGMEIESQSAFAKREHIVRRFIFALNLVWINSTKIRIVM